MNKIPKCISNSSATHICMNDKCNKPNPFICDANHDCKQHHRICVKLQWITFKEILEQNRQSINPTFKLLCDKVAKVITKGIQQLKAELDNFNQWKKQYGEVEKIIEFYDSIQLNKEVNWAGKDICQLKNDKMIKFDVVKIQNERIVISVKEIEAKRTEFLKMIRALYEVQKQQKNIIKIKSKKLGELNKKLEQIIQQPEHLELKFGIRVINIVVHQFQSYRVFIIEYQMQISKLQQSMNDFIIKMQIVVINRWQISSNHDRV